uniref:Mur ligase family protein n=1 Tax=uncultured Treponema sp. TaxID=162155 RepID=UPI0025928DD5
MPHIYPHGCYFNSLDEINGKKITIMGLGLNGGGEACVRFFLRHGAFVTVTDMKTAEQLAPTLESLAKDRFLDKSRLHFVLGGHKIEDFSNADCVIKNPGVKIEGNQFLAAAKAIETDISIFLRFTKAPIIAVTGSKGKSSTVGALSYGLNQAGFKCFLGGNITVSPLSFLEKTDGTTPVVLELSSWQLADLRGRKLLKPKISIITKIVPDHQNWYGDMDSYVEDKKLIFADQDKNDFTILDFDEDNYLKETASPKRGCRCWGDLFASETKAKVLRYSKVLLPKGIFG